MGVHGGTTNRWLAHDFGIDAEGGSDGFSDFLLTNKVGHWKTYAAFGHLNRRYGSVKPGVLLQKRVDLFAIGRFNDHEDRCVRLVHARGRRVTPFKFPTLGVV